MFLWLVVLVALASPARAWAEDEARLKVDLDAGLQRGEGEASAFRPMLRTEQRFRDAGLVLLKISAGLRVELASWLKLQSYYAHKDMLGAAHRQEHMAVLEAFLRCDAGPLRVTDRNGGEWHATTGFFRYRNNLDLHLDTGWEGLRFFVADEVRFDSDEGRLTMNDGQVGADLRWSAALTLRAYYDLESKRRGGEEWVQTHVLGLTVLGHL